MNSSLPPRISTALAFSLALAWSGPSVPLAAGIAPIGPMVIPAPAADGPASRIDLGLRPAPSAKGQLPGRIALYPTYAWPMERALGDGLICGNYVDNDPTAGLRDFMNGAWTYDTHRGTDIGLYDFKAMDRGFKIVAAAPGTVTSAVWANLRDRNCAEPDNPTLNYIEVANGDGTQTYYYHLRANSMTVNLGEAVVTGQMLGMAGSSGYSFGPHLHFEAADWLGGPYVARDPWGGPGNPNPGLWAAQEPYGGTEPFIAHDHGVFTETAVGGDLFNFDYCSTIAERVQAPVEFGLDEPWLAVWLYPQGAAGDSYTVEVRQPDNSLFGDVTYVLPDDVRGGYHFWAWYFSPWATQTGKWKARILRGATLLREQEFEVGATSIYGPRLKRSGRSFRVNGAAQKDTLRLRPLGAAGTSYSLLGAPAFVGLTDSVVTVAGVSDQPYRSAYFQVVATNGGGARDTAWYHVVDPLKPFNPTVSVEDVPSASRLVLHAPHPNPSAGPVTLRFSVPRPGRMSLALFDVAGRRVRQLAEEPAAAAGSYSARWDGRDEDGRPVAPGMLLARLTLEGEVVTARIAHVR
jgi:murein DD-endopeptidase MepM/ murein hydrolase activator NlpD